LEVNIAIITFLIPIRLSLSSMPRNAPELVPHVLNQAPERHLSPAPCKNKAFSKMEREVSSTNVDKQCNGTGCISVP
jgi:hypothetical protein